MSQTPQEMTGKVLEAGLWHTEGGDLLYRPESFNGSVENSHQFGFTPTPISLPDETLVQMQAIAAQIPAYYSMLHELGDQLPNTGISSQYRGLALGAWEAPPITMVDAMLTADGDVRIAEVDVINPRGLGYLALYGLLHDDANMRAALGVVEQAARDRGAELTILQGSLQNFYGPFFRLLQQALHISGVACNVTLEHAITPDGEGLLQAGGEPWQPSLLLDFPILKKMLKKAYGPLADYIIQAYNSGELGTLYPPQPQLSSKLLLAKASERQIFGANLPETIVCADQAAAEAYLATGRYCIKAAVSSGMKGLWLPSGGLSGVKFPVVAQRLISDQQVLELVHATGSDEGWQAGKFLARLSLFVSANGTLAAADITAQPYNGAIKGVHGNPDCVLAPVALTA